MLYIRKALREQLSKKNCLADVNKDPNFNQIYRLTTALAFVPPNHVVDVFTDVLEPLVDSKEEELSDESLDWFDYFSKMYIGARNDRRNERRPARIRPDRWSQYDSIMQEKPYTTNSVEGFNSAWNSSCILNSTVWVTVENFGKEECTAMARWREDLTFVEQRAPAEADPGTSRSIKQRNKVAALKNLCESFTGFSGAFKAEYLKLVSAAIED